MYKPNFVVRIFLLVPALLLCTAFKNDDDIMEVKWPVLEQIPFDTRYVPEIKNKMLFPKFPQEVKMLAGKRIKIEGYVIPVDKEGKLYALSANPYAACYFCGKAGPASVMTIRLKEKSRIRLDSFRSFTGTLQLNSTDIHEFYYILQDAILVKKGFSLHIPDL